MKQRILGLDLLRVVAMIFVIIDHTIVCGLGADDVTMMHIIVGDSVLFFMISGAVLLPIEGSGVAFLTKQFSMVEPPSVPARTPVTKPDTDAFSNPKFLTVASHIA